MKYSVTDIETAFFLSGCSVGYYLSFLLKTTSQGIDSSYNFIHYILGEWFISIFNTQKQMKQSDLIIHSIVFEGKRKKEKSNVK